MDDVCTICGHRTEFFGNDLVLGNVPVEYRRCANCGGIRLPQPHWLDRAYAEAINSLDVGLLDRCTVLSHVTAAVLFSEKLRAGPYLDWAGGYGTLARLMRDRGYAFQDHDPFAKNIFNVGHRLDELAPERRFELITAFEVLEHLDDPVDQLAEVAEQTDLLLMTTKIVPTPPPPPGEWDYYAPETGQHITFYTPAALSVLARRLGYQGVVSGSLVHLLHRRPIKKRTAGLVRSHKFAYLVGLALSLRQRSRSLLGADQDEARRAITGISGPPGSDEQK